MAAITLLLLWPIMAFAWSPSKHLTNPPRSIVGRRNVGTTTPPSRLFVSARSGPFAHRRGNPSGHRPLPKQKETRSSSLHNIVGDGLGIEIDEIESELRVRKAIRPPGKEAREDESTVVQQQQQPPPMNRKDGASIIAGTAIGGGFLALPSVTSPIGYFPTATGLLASWGFLVLSAVAFIEAAGLVSDARSRREKLRGATADEKPNGGGSDDDDDPEESGLAISSIIREAFGKKWGVVSGLAFIAQMVAVMTIQVVKGAAIASHLTGMTYALACVVPSCVAALFTFFARPEVVEGVNTSLTTMMIGGFALLCLAAVTAGGSGGAAAASSAVSPFARADWASLLPNPRTTWSIPVLMKLLAWGEAMPLVTERMVETTRRSSSSGEAASNGDDDENESIAVRAGAQKNARRATALGSSVPLVLCLLWAAISTALVDPASPDPITFLLGSAPGIAIPVGLLSIGAIGTTLLSSFLAMSHFASDVICTFVGYCDLGWMNAARVLTVALPCLCAFAGPGLYLPLLAFAGAYPTTLLYGLAPSLAAIVLRNRAGKEGVPKSQLTPSLIPGGRITLAMLTASSLAIVGSCTASAVSNLLKIVS